MKAILCIPLVFIGSFFLRNDENDLPINKIQVVGSHNSYKQAIDPVLFKAFQQMDSVSASKLDYGHIGFGAQLSLGLRNLEIDVYADAKGGKYSHPKGLEWAKNQQPYDADHEMDEPGFKILHVPDLDFRSHALTFKGALQQLRKWSEAHPDHTPVFITLEAKDDSVKRAGFTQPEKFTESTFDELDRTIADNLGTGHLITPDQVRGKYLTLEDAVLHGNWPLLKSAKGKFLFIFDAQGEKRARYVKGHPSLKGRVLFANADPGNPEAAMMIRNNSKDTEILQLVKKGYIVRTRADSDTRQARNNDLSYFEAACKSGAQIITTDYYQKSTHFKSDYVVRFEGGKYFRINPLFK
ncbi:MAG TPA: phosphatidylinositol-specific phospholipase C1-like protein [Pedobacter sp.]|uniref:phosphatidylinositol-specific phospholipase C1-like protein n=1 Tax=Pedobacter sp. TaxID=1411316 RepID=UPI002D17B2AC|nr:phosphatidylinositol-specific phospholipase C1-like protein [Pedobacter sp.]HMI05684.1 phosphatidylinositol-specific phospholipase C1-like protein [Pedobacter sp.]